MKKISLILSLSFLAVACSSTTSKPEANQHMTMASSKTVTTNDSNAVVDPVCGMVEKDIAYTEFSIYQTDTVWFCSPHCKETFDKSPAKYFKN